MLFEGPEQLLNLEVSITVRRTDNYTIMIETERKAGVQTPGYETLFHF